MEILLLRSTNPILIPLIEGKRADINANQVERHIDPIQSHRISLRVGNTEDRELRMDVS